jgi:glutamate-1-semialdehyde 2,1-aminomutase
MKNNKNTGQTLWEKAKQIIPGGSQLLSKRSEIFLPNLWPSYYSKAKGCEIWDLDNNHYYDFAGMGISSCILGYADQDVDNAVKKAISSGSMGTLNSAEEVELAEKLISIHPWSDMARFTRSGGEACSVAVRIARAASGKDKVVFCGYHGWHDWYISTNLSKDNSLDGQLLPGLEPNGIPRALTDTTIPFTYNDFDSFNSAIKNNQDEIGVIILEPSKSTGPREGFLEHIRATADRIGAVLIFDEVTSGFHNNFGGIHLTFGVNPDIAVFAKALGNGYPIASIIGTRKVMEAAQTTFISSTTWTERVGFTAALATITKMENLNVQKKLLTYGTMLKEGWLRLANKRGLKISITGITTIPNFSFEYNNSLAIQTFFTQQMLERGYLARTGTAVSYSYNEKIISNYLHNVDLVFGEIIEALKKGNIEEKLKGPIKHATFKRLTGKQ